MEAKRASLECSFNKLFTKNVPHIREKIFFNLDYTSFKQCMEVSSAWHELLKSDSYKRLGKINFQKDIRRDLRCAFDKGNENEIIKILRSGVVDLDGFYLTQNDLPLVRATEWGWKDVVKYLLEEGADVNKREKHNGLTALHEAAIGGHYDIAKLLFVRGANINVRDIVFGFTPLHAASIGGHTNVVKLLLDAGADVNVTNMSPKAKYPNTPLFFALQCKHTKTIQLLQEHGGTTL